jgi:hypothetical protein
MKVFSDATLLDDTINGAYSMPLFYYAVSFG